MDTKIENKDVLDENQLKAEVKENDNLKESKSTLTAAQRARAERNRLKACALRDAKLVLRAGGEAGERVERSSRALDSGGGFLLEEEEEAAAGEARVRAGAAPLVHRSEQPECELCGQRFPQSYLFDTFDHSVCDACREESEEHSLMTRSEAKSEFLLKDCDLDLREPALRCERRRNPHRARFAEMRLYLRAQVRARALLVWGSVEALEREREQREERARRGKDAAARRRLRALRMDVRSSLFEHARAAHQHAFGPERYDARADAYSRACDCGHVETYEKM